MALATVERKTMARKASENKAAEKLESVKLPSDVMQSARIIATLTGKTLPEILGEILRPALAQREREEMERRARQIGGKGLN